MLAADFELNGFSSRDWRRLIQLFPGPISNRSEPGRGGGVVVLAEGNRLCGLWRAQEGPISASSVAWPQSLPDLAEALEAPWVARLGPNTLLDLQERFGSRLRANDSLQDQWVKLLVAIQELVFEDAISVWPKRLFTWPAAVQDTLARSAFELMCPPGKCLLLGAFEQGQLYTAVVLCRGAESIERVVGPDDLRPAMGLLSGDWLRDYTHLLDAVETHFGPVAGGCFGEASTLKRLLSERAPGSFSQAVAARDIVLQPVNPALAVSLGFDVGRAAYAGVQSLTQRIASTPLRQHPAVRKVQQVAKGDSQIEDLLGFDPVSAIGDLLMKSKNNSNSKDGNQ